MNPAAYYNEIDPFAAAWLRELIKAGHIAPGEVDTRSIEDVLPADLAGFTQCHLFAGIGVWSYALRCAGWPDDRPVWTGSCPCQPFSAAGKRKGFADERHLWPAFFHLINECRPVTIFGEQVGSKDGLTWLDTVQTDLEAADYTIGAVNTPSAGFGAPHIRQRLYWLANALPTGRNARRPWPGNRPLTGSGGIDGLANATGSGGRAGLCDSGTPGQRGNVTANCAAVCRLDNPDSHRRQTGRQHDGEHDGQQLNATGHTGRLGDPRATGLQICQPSAIHGKGRREERGAAQQPGCPPCRVANSECKPGCAEHGQKSGRRTKGPAYTPEFGSNGKKCGPGPTNGYWRNADWLLCRDDKWRPVEPAIFPLAYGITNRVGLLRGAGNAINAEQAKEFITAAMDVLEADTARAAEGCFG